MRELIIELTLALFAATLIGWLWGRFVCKSGEHEERAQRRRLAAELATTGKDLEASREAVNGLRRQLGEQSLAAAMVEQDRARMRTEVEAMERTQAGLLEKLQDLEVCQARHRALAAEYDQSQRQALELRSTCGAQAEEIRALQETLEWIRGQLGERDAENRRRQEQIDLDMTEIAALRQRQTADEDGLSALMQENSDLEQRLQELGDAYASSLNRLERLAAAVDRLHQRIRERAASGRVTFPRRRRASDPGAAKERAPEADLP